MHVKTLILLVCCGTLAPCVSQASVDSIMFRFNQDARIIDIATTGVTTLDAENGASLGAQENENTLGADDDVPPMEPTTRSDCVFNASGETDTDCICPTVGSVTGELVASGDRYVCCDMASHKIYRGGSYSKEFMPLCGCLDGYRAPWTGSDPICCNGGKRWYHILEESSPISVEDAERCGCPENSTMVMDKNGKTHCCRDLIDLWTSSTGESNPEICGCVAEDDANYDTNCNKDLCNKTDGHEWCDVKDQCVSDDSCEITSKEACDALGANWCIQSEEKFVCQKAACCAQEGQKQAEDGVCVTCPEDGVAKKSGADATKHVCCKGTQLYEEDKKIWRENFLECGCPDGGEYNTINGHCCKDNFAWGARSGGTENGYVLVKPEACGCPLGIESTQIGDTYRCCESFNEYNETDHAYTYFSGMCGCPEGQTSTSERLWVKWASGKTVEGDTYQICCADGEMKSNTQLVIPQDAAADAETVRNVFVLNACGCADGATRFEVGEEIICCKGGQVTQRSVPDSTVVPQETVCLCAQGTWTGSYCEACKTNSDCEDEKICWLNEQEKIKSCVQCPGDKPHYVEGVCYECGEDSHCAERTDGKKVCDLNTHTCESCVLYNDALDKNHGCVEQDNGKPFCVKPWDADDKRVCAECSTSADCRTREDGKTKCNLNKDVLACTDECGGDSTYDSKTGECTCPSGRPIYDFRRKMCVKCYDSISENWTDLGCGSSTSEKDYSPGEEAKKSGSIYTPICKISSSSDLGSCVECLTSLHCRERKKCTNNTCACAAPTEYDTQLKMCVECRVNYGVNESNKKACKKEKPICNSDYACEACPDGKSYTTSTHECISCNLETHCFDKNDKGEITCVKMSDYTDVEQNSDGTCKKKKLTTTYHIAEPHKWGEQCEATKIEGNQTTKLGKFTCFVNTEQSLNGEAFDKIYGQDEAYRRSYKVASDKFKFRYSHKLYVWVDYADSCVYGTNLTGQFKQADCTHGEVCAKMAAIVHKEACDEGVCCSYPRCPSHRTHVKVKTTVEAGTYDGLEIIIGARWGWIGLYTDAYDKNTLLEAFDGDAGIKFDD